MTIKEDTFINVIMWEYYFFFKTIIATQSIFDQVPVKTTD